MAPAVETSGTQTATISTEHSLATPTTAKTRQLVVDLSNLVAGDIVELRLKRKVLSGGTIVTQYLGTYAGPVAEPVVASVPLAGPYGATFTLTQTAGTGRAFPWSVEVLD